MTAAARRHPEPTRHVFRPLRPAPREVGLALAISLIIVTWSATGSRALGPTPHGGWPLAPEPVVVQPFEPPLVRWGAGHRGADLAAVPGQQVHAPIDGVLAFTGTVAGVPAVSLDHPDGTRTTYQPAVTALARGTAVSAGAAFAVVVPGTSHCAPRTCLHWGLRRGKEYLDPLSLVEVVRIRLLPLAR